MLIQEGVKGIYKSNRKEIVGLPNTPPPLVLKLYLLIEGKNIEVQKPLKYRKNDPVKGEVTTTFQVLPSATANLNTPVQLFGTGQTKKVIVQVKNLGKSFRGKLSLKSPESWVIEPSHQEVMIDGKGIEKEFIFNVTAPKSEEVVQLRPELTNDKEKIQSAIQEISYDHIPQQYIVQPSSTRAVALNLKTGVERVAYINGAGDNVAESIEAVGVIVEKFDSEDITLEKLKSFDAVILGIRAFNVHESLSYKKNVLWTYAHQGGNLLIQYNTSRGLKTRTITPYSCLLYTSPSPRD